MPKNPVPSNEPAPVAGPVISPASGEFLQHYMPDRDAVPVVLTDVLTAMGLTGPRVPAKSLLDQPFILLAAKQFGSSFDPDRHAYFCVIRPIGSTEVVTTVLGGWAVTDILDAVVSSGMTTPLQCVLREHEGGRYGRYYVLE